jgi:hypothetical protein
MLPTARCRCRYGPYASAKLGNGGGRGEWGTDEAELYNCECDAFSLGAFAGFWGLPAFIGVFIEYFRVCLVAITGQDGMGRSLKLGYLVLGQGLGQYYPVLSPVVPQIWRDERGRQGTIPS